ncbi:MAG TPA: SGNH/GDSL hydrolase family protein [Vicinamibacteria bacterium]|nr:SGNH/GDSL hydrolase family protein [Vicinamibacteria bacterium]
MKSMKNCRTLLGLALGLAARGVGAQSFEVYVSVGDSLAAGFSNGSLLDRHQATSVPALLARQGGATSFEQPTIAAPGIPPELRLVSLTPPVIAPVSSTPGQPTNLGLERPYNNLAVPGATVGDALTTVSGGLHDVILRGGGTQVAQAVALRPTFITLWIGNNDVLGAALRGQAVSGVTLTPAQDFRQAYLAILVALNQTGARIVAANLPDVTAIPFVTTIPPVVINPATREPVVVNGRTIPLLGPNGPLSPNAFVTLAASSLLAQGVGIPRELGGQGTPLPNEVVLDPGEAQTIRDHVNTHNQIIRELCAAANIPMLDIHALLDELAVFGREIGGVRINADFLTGGFFGYDGVHPTDLGYAILANEWIGVINQNGGSLPLVDLAPFFGVAAASQRRAVEFSDDAWRNLLAVFPPLD